jgi:class 3 adenylate cyclase
MNLARKMFPEYAANQIIEKGVVDPKLHKNTTVFFSDIEGFTAISSKCSPAQVMSFLNRLYLIMDDVCSLFPDLYKVETIGDGYVISNNILNDQTSAENICQFALLVSKIVEIVQTPLHRKVRIRIGLHSGDIVSGVIGNLMPRFQLFGDTINTASRMETLGEPHRVHISSATAELLMSNNNFVIIKRGNIQVKGKGEMETFWLEASENNKLLSDDNVESLKLKYSNEIDFSKTSHIVDDLSTSAHNRVQQRDYIETKLRYLELGLQETV